MAKKPDITILGPARPETPKKKKKPIWIWPASAAALLLTLVALGYGLWRHSRPSPPQIPDPSHVVSDTKPEPGKPAPVKPRIPEPQPSSRISKHPTPAPKPSSDHGGLRVLAQAPDYADEFLAVTAKRLRLDTNTWQNIEFLPYTINDLPSRTYEPQLEVEGFSVTGPPTIMIGSGRTNELVFTLTPLPATLIVDCNATNAVAQIARQKSSVEVPLPVPSLQTVDMTISAPGYQNSKIAVGPFDPMTTTRMEVVLEEGPPSKQKPEPYIPPDETVMTIDMGNRVTMDLVWIPPGTFRMGSPSDEEGKYNNEGPQHQVTINRGFWMGKHAVTQRQYQQLMGVNPSHFIRAGRDAPVEQVSWHNAKQFCKKLQEHLPAKLQETTVRLPMEAEWEYACRAGTTTPFYYGNSLDSSMANFNGRHPYGDAPEGPNRQTTMRAGSFAPNSWGLYDMHGNVWEWCEDGKREYTSLPQTDPEGSGIPRMLRGGSWNSRAGGCRSAVRFEFPPGVRVYFLGFRVVIQ